jgi:hypothetical protein
MALTVGLKALDQRLNAFLQGADSVASGCASLEDIWNNAQEAGIMNDAKAQQFRTEQRTDACYSRQPTDSLSVLAVFLDALLRCALWPITRKTMIVRLHGLFQYPMENRDALVRNYVRLFMDAARTEIAGDTEEQILALVLAVVDEVLKVFPSQRDLTHVQGFLQTQQLDSTLYDRLAEAIVRIDPDFAEQHEWERDRAVYGDTLKYADSRQNDDFYNEWGR